MIKSLVMKIARVRSPVIRLRTSGPNCRPWAAIISIDLGVSESRSEIPNDALAYAKVLGLDESGRRYLTMKANAAAVFKALGTDVPIDRWRHLAEVHSALQWLWSALVASRNTNLRKFLERLRSFSVDVLLESEGVGGAIGVGGV
jgi:hypothetical protein